MDVSRGWPAEVVEELRLGGLLERRIVELSGGEQQRVALAAALVGRPEVLLLDEPTSNLACDAATALADLLAGCAQRFGTCFVAAEHRAEHLIRLVDGAIRLGPFQAGEVREASFAPASQRPNLHLRPGCNSWSGLAGTAPLEVLPEALNLPALRRLADSARTKRDLGEVLNCRGLSCRRSGRVVLEGIDLGLRGGEIVGLTGPNGAGKTSLLLLLAGGLSVGRHGQITWHDERGRRRRAPPVGLLFQNPMHQLFCDTVRQEVRLAADNADLPLDGPYQERLLAAADLASLADRPTLTLSYGEQQRTALAAALSARPAVVLLDEPTHGMDARRLEKIIRLVLEVRRKGTAFIVASHDRTLLEAFCDRIIILQHGRVESVQEVTGPTESQTQPR
jgi:energy-coupling factor transport system ATP-binding protein